MRKIQTIVLFTALLGIAGLSSCKGEPEKIMESEAVVHSGVSLGGEQLVNAHLSFGVLEDKLLSSDFPARGKLVLPPERKALVNSLYSGIVKSIEVRSGALVNPGSVLAYVSSPEIIQLQQEYLSVSARLSFLKNEFDRQSALNNEEVNATKVMQRAESEFLEARALQSTLAARLKLAGLDPAKVDDLHLTEVIAIKSPIYGKVEKVNIVIGQSLREEMPSFEIVDTRKLYVEIAVFEKDILSVAKGQRISFELSNLDETEYEANVISIGSVVENDARVVSILAEFNNTAGLLPGMFAAAKIHAGEKHYKALPEDAVMIRSEDEKFIFYTLNDSADTEMVFQKAMVETGFREDGWVQIISSDPLPAGAMVVFSGVYYIWGEMEKQLEE